MIMYLQYGGQHQALVVRILVIRESGDMYRHLQKKKTLLRSIDEIRFKRFYIP